MAGKKINTDLDFQDNQVKNMRLERIEFNSTYISPTRAGQIVYRPDIQRFIGTTEGANNTYQNQIAWLSDIQNNGGGSGSSAPIPQKTLFVSPNFNNTNKHYSNVINAYNNASSGDTIVIYSGSYPFPPQINKKITFNCLGDVTLTSDTNISINDHCAIIGNVNVHFGDPNGRTSVSGNKVYLNNSYFVVKCKLFVAYCIFQQNNSIAIIDADVFYSNIEFTQSNYPMHLELTARRIGNGGSTSQYAPHIANPFFVFKNCNSRSHARIAAINDKSRVHWDGNNINNLDIKRVKYSYDTYYSQSGLPAYV